MSLRAGRLRQRVTLMRKMAVVDANGGRHTAWTAIGAPIAAEVIGLDGREAVIGHALQGISVYRVTIRYRTGITDADQLAYGAMKLNIRSAIDPDARRERIEILADTASAEKTG